MENKEVFTPKQMMVILSRLTGPSIWGLHPEKGWVRPFIINVDNKNYMLVNNEDKGFDEPYYDYSEDIKNGDYEYVEI